MKVDLSHVPYRRALELVQWCFDHNIDRDRCAKIISATTTSPFVDVEWAIDVPDKYMTYFALKWSNDAPAQPTC